MLCQICQNIFQQEVLTDPRGRLFKGHHKTALSFRDSAQQECQICTPMWRQFSKEGQLDLLQLQKGTLCTKYYLEESEQAFRESEHALLPKAPNSYELSFHLDEGVVPNSLPETSRGKFWTLFLFILQPIQG
jgi:hypothetical protein